MDESKKLIDEKRKLEYDYENTLPPNLRKKEAKNFVHQDFTKDSDEYPDFTLKRQGPSENLLTENWWYQNVTLESQQMNELPAINRLIDQRSKTWEEKGLAVNDSSIAKYLDELRTRTESPVQHNILADQYMSKKIPKESEANKLSEEFGFSSTLKNVRPSEVEKYLYINNESVEESNLDEEVRSMTSKYFLSFETKQQDKLEMERQSILMSDWNEDPYYKKNSGVYDIPSTIPSVSESMLQFKKNVSDEKKKLKEGKNEKMTKLQLTHPESLNRVAFVEFVRQEKRDSMRQRDQVVNLAFQKLKRFYELQEIGWQFQKKEIQSEIERLAGQPLSLEYIIQHVSRISREELLFGVTEIPRFSINTKPVIPAGDVKQKLVDQIRKFQAQEVANALKVLAVSAPLSRAYYDPPTLSLEEASNSSALDVSAEIRILEMQPSLYLEDTSRSMLFLRGLDLLFYRVKRKGSFREWLSSSKREDPVLIFGLTMTHWTSIQFQAKEHTYPTLRVDGIVLEKSEVPYIYPRISSRDGLYLSEVSNKINITVTFSFVDGSHVDRWIEILELRCAAAKYAHVCRQQFSYPSIETLDFLLSTPSKEIHFANVENSGESLVQILDTALHLDRFTSIDLSHSNVSPLIMNYLLESLEVFSCQTRLADSPPCCNTKCWRTKDKFCSSGLNSFNFSYIRQTSTLLELSLRFIMLSNTSCIKFLKLRNCCLNEVDEFPCFLLELCTTMPIEVLDISDNNLGLRFSEKLCNLDFSLCHQIGKIYMKGNENIAQDAIKAKFKNAFEIPNWGCLLDQDTSESLEIEFSSLDEEMAKKLYSLVTSKSHLRYLKITGGACEIDFKKMVAHSKKSNLRSFSAPKIDFSRGFDFNNFSKFVISCPFLRFIDLSYSNFFASGEIKDVTNRFAAIISSFQNLISLRLRKSSLDDLVASATIESLLEIRKSNITAASSIQVLDLSFNKISHTIFSSFVFSILRFCPYLRCFDLTGNRLEAQIVASELNNLKEFVDTKVVLVDNPSSEAVADTILHQAESLLQQEVGVPLY
eukprot:GHVP01064284.1.p1 GENE.GHVP01064284.1~~GHVP01064284.1.p1  ORF type:complete len:1044 (-),score=229.65 GHVP01064284.1:812-3943(-)